MLLLMSLFLFFLVDCSLFREWCWIPDYVVELFESAGLKPGEPGSKGVCIGEVHCSFDWCQQEGL